MTNLPAPSPTLADGAEILPKGRVCELLQVSPRCLETMVAQRRFPPAVRIGKSAYWSRKVLDEWLRREFGVQESFFKAGRR